MSAIDPVAAVTARLADPVALPIGGLANVAPTGQPGFADILTTGLQSVDAKIGTADALVKSFALDGSVPIHQVTAALEEARLAVEVAMQVRTRLVETYRDFMAMQV